MGVQLGFGSQRLTGASDMATSAVEASLRASSCIRAKRCTATVGHLCVQPLHAAGPVAQRMSIWVRPITTASELRGRGFGGGGGRRGSWRDRNGIP